MKLVLKKTRTEKDALAALGVAADLAISRDGHAATCREAAAAATAEHREKLRDDLDELDAVTHQQVHVPARAPVAARVFSPPPLDPARAAARQPPRSSLSWYAGSGVARRCLAARGGIAMLLRSMLARSARRRSDVAVLHAMRR